MFHTLMPVLFSFLLLPLARTEIIFDVATESITVSLADGSSAVLIHRDFWLPVRNKVLFTTVNPNQEKTILDIYAGERKLASANKLLGTLHLDSYESGKQATIEIIAQQDSNRKVKVSAAVVGDGAVAGFWAPDGSWETEIVSQDYRRKGYGDPWYGPNTDVASDLLYINQGLRQLELHTGRKINRDGFRRLAHREHGSVTSPAIVIRNRISGAHGTMKGLCCFSWRCLIQSTGYMYGGCKIDEYEVQDQAYSSWWTLQKLRMSTVQRHDQCTEDERTKALSIVVGDVFHGIMPIAVSPKSDTLAGYGTFGRILERLVGSILWS